MSASAGGGARSWVAGPLGESGPRSALGWAAAKQGWRSGFLFFLFFSISNSYFQTFLNSKQISNSNHLFESKHPKTMHQHVCNSKLLYFINLIKKSD
jgi:hypothetical protein